MKRTLLYPPLAKAILCIISSITIGALIAVGIHNTGIADNRKHGDERACVVLGYQGNYVRTTNIVTYDDGITYYTNVYARQIGLIVSWVSRSPNAPEVNVNSDLAENIAWLLENRMVQRDLPTYGLMMFTK